MSRWGDAVNYGPMHLSLAVHVVKTLQLQTCIALANGVFKALGPCQLA